MDGGDSVTGIEILSSAQVVAETTFNCTAFWIIFGIFFGIIEIVALGLWLSGDAGWTIVPCFSILGIALGLVFGSMGGEAFATHTAYETHYKVTISDEVSLNEFYEYYEVIDQEGRIFTVRERVE